MSESRRERQRAVYRWALDCFGVAIVANIKERALRFLEEAIELAQAVGVPEAKASALVEYVYAKPPGGVAEEVGGVGLTLLAFAESAGLNADRCEANELRRVASKPGSHWRKRYDKKINDGMVLLKRQSTEAMCPCPDCFECCCEFVPGLDPAKCVNSEDDAGNMGIRTCKCDRQ